MQVPGLRFRNYRRQFHGIVEHVQLRLLSVRQERDVLLLRRYRLVTEVPASAFDLGIKSPERYWVERVLCCFDGNLGLGVLDCLLLLKREFVVGLVVLEDSGHLRIGQAEKLFYLGKSLLRRRKRCRLGLRRKCQPRAEHEGGENGVH